VNRRTVEGTATQAPSVWDVANEVETGLDLQQVDEILDATGRESRHVVAILQAIQERFGYLPQAALMRVCERTEITPEQITGVATFYAQFRLRPAGRHNVKVCVGTACHVMGADAVVDALHDHLQIPDGGDTDPDRVFTVERVACLGCCMLAPAVQIDEITYGPVRPDGVPAMLHDFLSAQVTRTADVAPPAANAVDGAELRVCCCSSCVASGAGRVRDELVLQVANLELDARVVVVGCTGMAYRAPLVELAFDDGRSYRYGSVTEEHVRHLLVTHLQPRTLGLRWRLRCEALLDRLLTDERGAPVTRYLVDTGSGPDARFDRPQHRLVTAGGGRYDPVDLATHLDGGGFSVATRCLAEDPGAVLDRLAESGLRGRGGAGFPTARKWKAVRSAPGSTRYVVCNGDEGDPGAFMDRQILESFPYRVIEGMMIAATVVGAERGVLYIRAEYPLAVQRVREAISRLESAGLLGETLLGRGRPLQLEVVPGAGAFVCGEETALLEAVEGRRGIPRLRPPYPAEEGLNGCPTLVNNVETFALVPVILGAEAAAFANLGTPKSRGTKTFALAGKVKRSGLVEVPMGTPLRTIVEDVGGGTAEGRTFKAVQVGGPSGGCVPAALAGIPVDYEALSAAGAMMGSGGLVVLDDTDCMVDIARYFMAFTQAESCGRCTYCRIGTRRMLEVLQRLCDGQGREGDLERLEEIAAWVRDGSLCGLGRTAPNPVLSTLEHFREEYRAHIEGFCPAGRCRELTTFRIGDACTGCTRCMQHCVAGAIRGAPHWRHQIEPELCTRCGLCRTVCRSGGVEVDR